jgi:hypothetical protein
MNLIRVRLILARRSSRPGLGQPQPSQLDSHRPPPSRRPACEGFAGRFIQHVAASAIVVTGQSRPTPATANSRRRAMAAVGPLPHTVQLCIHCRQRPAGFWVSPMGAATVRRPWCLSCCQDLDPGRCQVIPFDD